MASQTEGIGAFFKKRTFLIEALYGDVFTPLVQEQERKNSLMLLQEEIQVEQRLRHEAEDAMAEVERRLGSVEVEQQKICLVENDRAKSRAELLKAREEILDLTAKLEVERHRVRKLEAKGAGEKSKASH
eukprot:s6_g8.t1